MPDVDKIFPILWMLCDQFKIDGDHAKFLGSAEDIKELKELLQELDPTASRGVG